MAVVLTGRRLYFSRNLKTCLFTYQGSLTSRLCDSYSTFRLILTRCWIGIISMFVFTSNRHLLFIMSKFCKMAIILTGRWLDLSRNLISTFPSNKCSLTSWFCDSNGTFRLILTRCWIGIISMFVFTSNRHLLFRVTKRH
jgi:hypothetical protein